MRSGPTFAIAGMVAVLLAGCMSAPPMSASDTFIIAGAVTTWPDPLGVPILGQGCAAKPGFDDIRKGAQVVVTNQDGKTIAIGELASGVVVDTLDEGISSWHCKFGFRIQEVPSGEAFYAIGVGNSLRGDALFTEEELAEKVELILLD